VCLRNHLPLASGLRSDATRGWTASAIADRLGLREAWTEDALAALRAAGLVVKDRSGVERRFSYRPRTPALEAAVTTLAQTYEERPAYVARILNEDAISRVRWSASQAFPAAFGQGSASESRLHPRVEPTALP
jgi:DNA-binding MarR family transcriptional regulator